MTPKPFYHFRLPPTLADKLIRGDARAIIAAAIETSTYVNVQVGYETRRINVPLTEEQSSLITDLSEIYGTRSRALTALLTGYYSTAKETQNA